MGVVMTDTNGLGWVQTRGEGAGVEVRRQRASALRSDNF
jgi:hypothetical protein